MSSGWKEVAEKKKERYPREQMVLEKLADLLARESLLTTDEMLRLQELLRKDRIQ